MGIFNPCNSHNHNLPTHTVFILRGLPGSGKSELAKQLCRINKYSSKICEADGYFVKLGNGTYKFDSAKLYEAHRWCRSIFDKALSNRTKIIVVSNTNIRYREYKQYKESALNAGYRVVVLTVENGHGNKSIHNVPEEKIAQMRNNFTLNL